MSDSPSEHTSQPETPTKKKIQPACDHCHRRKVKCTFERPQCSNCKRRGNKCWYPEKRQKRQASQTKNESESLVEERLKRLESLLLASSTCTSPQISDHNSPSNGISKEPLDSKETDNSFFTLPQQPVKGLETNVIYHLDRRRFVIKDGRMPPKEIRDRLIKVYFDTLHHMQPLIHQQTFMEREKKGENSDLLILAICAASSIFLDELGGMTGPAYSLGEPFASRAQYIVQENLMKPSIDTIQALSTLFIYEFTAGNFGISQMYLELAFHYLKLSRIYRLDEDYQDDTLLSPRDWVEKETKRRVFWLTTVKDRMYSSEIGTPQLVDLFDCEVQLPCEDQYWENSQPITNAEKMDSDEEEMAIGMSLKPTNVASFLTNQFSIKVKIILILGQISRYANRPKAKRILSKRSLTARFTILEYALSAWWHHLPPEMKQDNDMYMGGDEATLEFECVHHHKIVYYGATILLHRTYLAHMADLFNNSTSSVHSSIQDANISVPESCLASMNKCTSTAFAVTRIIKHYHLSKPSYFNLFSSQTVFVASTIHLNNMFSSTGELAQRSKEAFDIHINFLNNLKTCRALVEYQLNILDKLKLVCSNINRHLDSKQHPGTISMQWVAPTTTGSNTWHDTLKEAFNRYCSTPFKDIALGPFEKDTNSSSSPDNPFRVGFSQHFIPLPEDLNRSQTHFTLDPMQSNSNLNTADPILPEPLKYNNHSPVSYDRLMFEKIYQESGLSSDYFDFLPLFNSSNLTYGQSNYTNQ
ncbi:hypothetical protein K7432_004161 [Basidiobolus ranarum]|uniref:Zn(2)-C6 fungal-type domain-containing protein n=1 Tax=Basidiobolus ranarum TaxID=34480 RepID=A0ABR2W515_9FUNG